MTDVSGPFDGTDWAEAEWYRFAARWAPDGVLSSSDLTLTTSGLSVTLGAGRAWVGGAGFERTAPLDPIPVPANAHASWSRRDRLVLRRSLANHEVAVTLLQGTPAASPTAPTISQNEAGDWDFKTWSFLVPPNSGTNITSLTDERVVVDSATSAAGQRITSVGTPTASTDAATKGYVDSQVSGAGTSAATASTVARRDGGGRLQVASPSASADAATKGYVDGKFSDTGWDAFPAALGTGWTDRGCRYRVNDGVVTVFLNATNGGYPAGKFVANLPAGARPSITLYFPSNWAGAVNNELVVGTDGDINLTLAGNSGTVTTFSFPV